MRRDDKKIFYDQYLNGDKDYYSMTFGEIEDAVGRGEAEEIWNDEKWMDIPDGKSYQQIITSYFFDEEVAERGGIYGKSLFK